MPGFCFPKKNNPLYSREIIPKANPMITPVAIRYPIGASTGWVNQL